MTKAEKDQFINNLKEKLDLNGNFYLADFGGLTVTASNNLRRKCYEKGISIEIVKNTLLKKAMEKSQVDYQPLYGVLKENTGILFTETANTPAKLIREFRKNNTKPLLKAAYIQESVYIGDNQIDLLADLKSKNELIADVIALLQSPAKNVISALLSAGNKISGILKTLEQKS